jgi:hypothetical protein
LDHPFPQTETDEKADEDEQSSNRGRPIAAALSTR